MHNHFWSWPVSQGTELLENLGWDAGHAAVTCQSRDLDRYDRDRRRLLQGERGPEPLDETVAFWRYSVDYVAGEDGARQSRINIWSGDFDMPWNWALPTPKLMMQ
jgi:endonuclease YncB( thermonuclease family)